MTVTKLVIGFLIILFSLMDVLPGFRKISFDRKFMPLGGAISGFFGGLSGHQGAMRSSFLLKAGLEKEAFIGTGVAVAVLVDCSRLFIYGYSFYQKKFFGIDGKMLPLVTAACLSAFLGAYFGRKLLTKVTFKTIQLIVGALLMCLGASMIAGFI